MNRPKRSRKFCVYCPIGMGETKDHVPPRGFIEDPVSNGVNLITVPCCEKCRNADQSNDDLMRDLFCSLESTETQSYVAKHIIPRRDRSFDKGHNLDALNAMMLTVDRFSENGIPLGKDLAFNVNTPQVRRFLERLGRALIFDSYGTKYFEADFGFVVSKDLLERLQRVSLPFSSRKVLGALSYSVSSRKDSLQWVILRFFDGVEFLLRFESTDEDT